MTVPLSPGSPRLLAARRFGAELRRAMTARRVGTLRLAAAAACTPGAIGTWKAGTNLPRTATAARLAEVLGWPRLAEIAAAGRTVRCARCGREFTYQGGAPARFCSADCREIDAQLRAPGAAAELAAALRAELARKAGVSGGLRKAPLAAALERYSGRESGRGIRRDRLAAAHAANLAHVADMCRSCEPEGVCHTPACALRPISPLPLAGDRQTAAIRPAAQARRWAQPGERERMAEGNRARAAARSPEERAAHNAAISAGRRRRSA